MSFPMNPLALATLALLATPLAAQERQLPPPIKPRSEEPAAEVATIRNWPERIAATDAGSRNEAWAKPEFDDSEWKTMTLPTHWEQAGLPDYDGVVWFRRDVELPPARAKGEALLHLGAIDDMDVTWVNGVRVGGHEEAGAHFTPRTYKLPAGTLQPGRNVIAVRVLDHGWDGGMAQTHGRMALQAGGRIALTGPWRFRKGADLAALLQASPDQTPATPHEPWKEGFELRDRDVVALAGGAGMVKQAESGYLETLLVTATGSHAAFRDIAWQADTVYRQQRPRNFGPHRDLLERIHASVIVANFGQMEALDGATQLASFVNSYENLLDEFSNRTPRIVLVGPYPYEKRHDPLLPDLSLHNGDVAAYSEAIRQLAERRGYVFVDLMTLDTSGHTTDGLQLSRSGRRAWAEAAASQLLHRGTVFEETTMQPIREAIQRKNVLWRQHWRPTNWSFLYGNRQHVPSSHDHRPGEPRWFPREIDAIIPMIEAEEQRVRTLQEDYR